MDIERIKYLAEAGTPLKTIGFEMGVSKQRIYQILTQYGITTPEQVRKRQSDNWSQREKWLWRMLVAKCKTTKEERLEILKSVKLPDYCPALGIKLDYSDGKGKRTDNSPSVDKIIPAKGYTPGNIVVLSWRANRIKNDAEIEELLKIYNFFTKLDT